MIGQKKLIAKLKSYSIATLPHSILLLGEQGCGKHELVKTISEYFKLEVKDITEDISLEKIQEIYVNATTNFYIIDMNKVTEKQQNVILKFLEEPSKTAYIILLCTSKSILLDTVVNRCQTFEFEPYTKDDLIQFLTFDADVDELLQYCHTPGQIIKTTKKQLDDTISLCDNIIANIRKAKYSNALVISSKFKYKDEDVDKLDVDLFYTVLLERLLLKYKKENDILLSKMYEQVSNSLKKFVCLRFNTEMLIESLITDLWNVCR